MLKNKSNLSIGAFSKDLDHELFRITKKGKAISNYRRNFPFQNKNIGKIQERQGLKK